MLPTEEGVCSLVDPGAKSPSMLADTPLQFQEEVLKPEPGPPGD